MNGHDDVRSWPSDRARIEVVSRRNTDDSPPLIKRIAIVAGQRNRQALAEARAIIEAAAWMDTQRKGSVQTFLIPDEAGLRFR